MAFTPEFKAKYHRVLSPANSRPVKMINVEIIPARSEMSMHKARIVEHMIDNNKHTNIKYYQEFALEGIVRACREGRLLRASSRSGTVESQRDLNIQSIGLIFQGDSRLGDELDIGVWEDNKNEDVVYSVISKGERTLVKLRICFQPRQPVQLASHL